MPAPKIEIRPSMEGSRACFRVYVNGQATSTFAYNEAKAYELLDQACKAIGVPTPKVKAKTIGPTFVFPAPTSAPKPTTAARSGAKQPFPKAGVMLAKTYEGVERDAQGWIKITGPDPTGWWMSEKLEGFRAYWTGDTLYTRQGNVIQTPDWFHAFLPQGFALDGELWLGRGRFEEVGSVVGKSTPRDPRWKQIQYAVFDAPDVPGGCEARWAAMEKIVAQACKGQKGCPIVAHPHTRCTSRRQLEDALTTIEGLEGEGIMLQKPGSPYTRTRASSMLKVKSFQDAEAIITGYGGDGKESYQAKLIDSGVAFDFDARHYGGRKNNDTLPVGTVVTVRFQRLSGSGKPVSPRLYTVHGKKRLG